ncbi:membrane-anchored junction protein [Mastacembelus armatus]|uniref:membrane-anchored junction protein n=1 Tax=Mastacembelus armatus TaxID=205130 RepID=UPI000E454883|nr:membrane-anchored junction protein [Mastacembelus armatus]
MPLQAFSFPFPETRFFRAGSLIYKFKIRGGSSYSGEETIEVNCFDQELEDIIRTVLGNLDSLQPFSSTNFNVFPYKKHWEGVSKVMCKHSEKKLRAYPFILFLYLEKNTQNGKKAEEKLNPEKELSQHFYVSEPQSKRCKTDSPLEGAILKDLIKDMAAESKASVMSSSQLHMDNPHAERGVKEEPGLADKDGGGEEEEEVENANMALETSGRSGILTRLASYVFPFSVFFRDH